MLHNQLQELLMKTLMPNQNVTQLILNVFAKKKHFNERLHDQPKLVQNLKSQNKILNEFKWQL